ncbi:Tyrosine-protein kinase etk [compost metagenome]
MIAKIMTILKHKNQIIAFSLTASLGATLFIALQPNQYTATATIIPVEKSTSSNLSSLLGAMGGGLGMFVSQSGFGGGTTDKFLAILHTRTLAESIIAKQNLLPVIYNERWDETHQKWKHPWFILKKSDVSRAPSIQDAVVELSKTTSIKSDKRTQVVSISFTAQDPEVASRVANAYVDELNRYLTENALSSAKNSRLFVENQLNKAKDEMANYELAMRNFQQKNKVVSLDAQAEASVKTYSDLKAKLIAAEVELSVTEKGSLSSDPRVALKQQEVVELKKQLSQFEDSADSSPIVSFHKAPSLGLSYARLKRELLIREKVFELLTQQYEMAKIQEAQEDISFQVLDHAVPPEKKTGPKRTTFVITAFITSLMFGVAASLVLDTWLNIRDQRLRL